MSLDSVLEVIDSDIFQPEIWSVIKAPIHGVLNGFSDTGISTGDTLLPQGLTYTPNIGFTGFDSFGIIIFDGFDSDELTVYVSIKPPSFVTSSLVTPLTCFGDSSGSIAISVTGSGPFYYHWSNGDSLASISHLEAGTYTLNLIQASTQCKLFDTFLITQPDSIHAVAMTGNDFCHSGLGFININVSGGVAPYKYAWSTGALTNDLNGLGAGIYFLTITDNSLCKKNLSVYLNDTCNEIIVHDVITPNGDGINDTWVIENIQVYPGNSVQVFDKWGDLVFGKNGYTNDWGGISKTGDFLPDGTYYYLVKLNAPNTGKGGNVFSGSLLIKR
jgi:gliding motility-associated-like protein